MEGGSCARMSSRLIFQALCGLGMVVGSRGNEEINGQVVKVGGRTQL